MHTVREISTTDTYALRRAVLRGGDEAATVAWMEDDRPNAFHLGAVGAAGDVIATASFSEEAIAERPGAKAWRLRGMAVAEGHQGAGLGGAMLAAAIDRIRRVGAEVLWCNARDTAMSFYANAGFVVLGEGFKTDETGLLHHRMVLDL